MVDKPDEDSAVFCRVLRDVGTVTVQGEEGSSDVELNQGDVWVLRWRDIRDGVLRGDVELIWDLFGETGCVHDGVWLLEVYDTHGV
jgi:GINS complex subunit 4